ncbi:unnamed protein product [Auanema sp. JU1783]|nr:unnamed protein product [Auanema sp. JU1783]
MLRTKIRAHLTTAAVITGTIGLAYGVFQIAMTLKQWTRASPRLMHQEMEDYMRFKALKAESQQQQPKTV